MRVRGKHRGSGFVIGPGVVLTAAHVVGGPSSAVVLTDDEGAEHDGVVAWRHPAADHKVDVVDVAVVRCREPFVDDFVRWGEVGGISEVRCIALGYPRAGEQDLRRKLVTARCTVMPMNGREDFLLESSGNTWPADGADGWPGMSGGPLVTEDGVLVGVVRGVPRSWTNALRAVRMTAIVEDPLFAFDYEDKLGERVKVNGTPTPTVVAALPAVYEADPLPVDWDPEATPLRLDPAGRCRLDTLVATSLRGFTAVVADSASGAARRRGTADALDGLGGRRWITVPDLDIGDPGSPEALRTLVGGDWRPSGRTGVVVPLVRGAVGGVGAATSATAQRTVRTLRSLLPDAVVLVRSIGPTPYDAARTAAELGKRLDCRAFLLRPDEPGDLDAGLGGRYPLATLAALARHGLVKRGLVWEVPEVPGEVEESPPAPAAIADALARTPMSRADIRSLLLTAWTSMPDTVAAVLPLLARTNCGSTALRVAVDCGLDFGGWLSKVRDVPAPGQPNALLAAAVVPVLVRAAAPRAAVRPWLDHGGPAMRLLRDRLTRDDGGWRFAVDGSWVVGDEAAPTVAAIASAAGVGPTDVDPGDPLFWALLTRTPYTQSLTRLVDNLDRHHRAVIDADDVELDAELRALVSDLRAQLPHLAHRR
ncbi:serine protease [Actinosynnema sp. NPDC091369]